MKLPDNEIRDITKLLEEGKPLPDKYRFILFGDEREIELVWNGKAIYCLWFSFQSWLMQAPLEPSHPHTHHRRHHHHPHSNRPHTSHRPA